MKNITFLFMLLCITATAWAQNIKAGKLYSIRSYQRGTYLYQRTNGDKWIFYDGDDCSFPNSVWRFEAVDMFGVYNVRNVHTGMCISYKNTLVTDRSNEYANLEVTYSNNGRTVTEAPFIRFANTVQCLSTSENNGIASIWGECEDFNRFYVEEVDCVSHQLEVLASGWATLMLGFNAVIPVDKDFKAYVVSAVEDGRIKLQQVTGVLGANTPILVNAPEGVYRFMYTDKASTVNAPTKFLEGTLYDKDITPSGTAFVLSLVDGEVCFCKVKLNKNNGRAFKNNANKAYLDISSAYLSSELRFNASGLVTSVTEVTGSQDGGCIYDLAGRRLKEIVSPGIYVVNGVKRLVK